MQYNFKGGDRAMVDVTNEDARLRDREDQRDEITYYQVRRQCAAV